jgi:excisionase family DNA binding protein
MPKPPPVVSVREVAEAKGISPQAVRTAIARGTLNSYRAGKTVLVLRDKALEAYLAAPPATNRKTDG